MPTQTKIDRVNELKEKLERSSIVVTANHTNIPVNQMTELRRRARAAGVEFLIIKNTLMHLAADAAHRPQVKEIVQGPTAIAFGYDDPVDVAKTLQEYIRSTRSALVIQGAVMGDGPALQPRDVERLAALPPKARLLANLLMQFQAPLYRLLAVLNGPLQNLDGLLQARIRQLESEAGAAEESPEASAAEGSPEAGAAEGSPEVGAAEESPEVGAAEESPEVGAAEESPETDGG